MVRRLKRLLISSAFLAALMAPATPVFADSTHGNSANAPGQNKTTSSQASQSSSTGSPGNSDHSKGNAGTSGTYNQPQPYSKADQNNTGANDTSSTNQYKSTRNGSPSLNGNGGGQANGKPCAGCVGKADNKNPKGQYPNGSDHNKGYECDKNNGIGKGNPAHTGCTSSTPACTGPNCGGMGGCTSNCGGNQGCTTNCGGTHGCTTNCSQDHLCTTTCQGRGGDEEVSSGSIRLAVAGPVSNALPNTGAPDQTSVWAIMAVLGFVVTAVYWRQFIIPLVARR